MLRLMLMLLTVMVGVRTAGADEGAPGSLTSTISAGHARSGRSTCGRRFSKRGGKRNGKMVGWPVPEKELLAEAPPRPSGDLHIVSVNSKDEAKVNIYNEDGSYNIQALAEVNHVFKCRRSGLEHEIDTRLVTVLSNVYDHFGGRRIELLSGYRFQRRTTSNHFHGAAADIRIAGVDPLKIRAFVSTLDAGGMGVGWYPKIGFVHVDVRQPPSYRWIDNSRSNPDARDRQLPRGFKRKNPES
jgi:uncharacterized protein YcbK (DUF882 family)